ncbi:hybrid sensor histidine kinase/response regulator [Limisalsivibrio acetivorans]|uniref:hybrid sensor histidine kinase/response regulator n=1 Tax=Limisalsivibrio acetivorans TaxID=1304888 RepID=UPI0003B66250|nr:response regulator [Limisalsivibrio acetivorans]
MHSILCNCGNATILFVEDDATSQRIIRLMFAESGDKIHIAGDGAEGLRMARELRPDIVISDYSMPVMNGLEMLRIIKDEIPGVKTVFMTVYTEPDVLIDAINLGVDRFLEKPINRDKLDKVLSDLLEDVERANKLREYQNLLKAYRKGVDSSTIFSLVDSDGNFSYVNKNLCNLSGYDEDELIGKPYSMLKVCGDYCETACIRPEKQKFHSVWQGCHKNRAKDGSEYTTEITLLPVYQGSEISSYISIEMDMTDVVKQHQEQLQAFFDADKTIMFAYDQRFRLSLCNKRFLKYFGYNSLESAREEGFCFYDHILEREGYYSFDAGSFNDIKEAMHSFFQESADRKVRKILIKNPQDGTENIVTFTVFSLAQKYLGLEDLRIIRLNDITELEHLKMEEVNQAMLASIGKLSAGITHEINTPLTYMKGNLEMMGDDIADGDMDSLESYLESINDGVSRISYIVDSMREVTGQSDFETEEANLYATLVVASRMIYNRAKQISPVYINGEPVSRDMDGSKENYPAMIVPRMLEQVWIILLNNSLDQLSQCSLPYEERYISITIEKDGEGHIIRIADNGGGIDDAILHRLFELFTSTKKHRGMGIGLNIAKSIIERHNGKILPRNDENGAVFEINI